MLNQTLPRTLPEEVGLSSAGVNSFLDAVQERAIALNSLMILRHGKIAVEGWYAPYTPEREHAMHSFTKGLTSTAIGLLISEGRVTLDDTVISYFPEYLTGQETSNLKNMKLRHLLTMTCGHEKEPSRQGVENYVKNFLVHPVPYEPGTHFYYNSMGTYMLCAVLRRVTGQNLTQYLRQRILEPLGIYDITFDLCPLGIENGGGGSYLRTEDMAKIGQLYLQMGMWQGKQLIPQDWVKLATSVQFAGSYDHMYPYKEDWKQGYGFQFWRCTQPESYRFDGSFGQFAVILPQQDAVIITTASDAMPEKILDLCWKYLLPAFGEKSTKENSTALRARLKRLQLPWQAATQISGQTQLLSKNLLLFGDNNDSIVPQWRRTQKPSLPELEKAYSGIRCCQFLFNEQTTELMWCEGSITNHILLGVDGNPIEGVLYSIWGDFPIAATGTWIQDNVFAADIRLLNTSHHARLEFGIQNDVVCLTLHETPYDTRTQSPAFRMHRLKKGTP